MSENDKSSMCGICNYYDVIPYFTFPTQVRCLKDREMHDLFSKCTIQKEEKDERK